MTDLCPIVNIAQKVNIAKGLFLYGSIGLWLVLNLKGKLIYFFLIELK
jgi:hypothetical protein